MLPGLQTRDYLGYDWVYKLIVNVDFGIWSSTLDFHCVKFRTKIIRRNWRNGTYGHALVVEIQLVPHHRFALILKLVLLNSCFLNIMRIILGGIVI